MPDDDTQISPAWLSATLAGAGALPQGAVLAVTTVATVAFNSRSQHLDVTYSADAPATAPRQIFVKRNVPAEWAVRAGEREVAFYRFMAAHRERLPMIVPCYAALYDPATGDSALLLRDVAATHHPPITRERQLTPGANIPAQDDIDRAIDALAQFHAYWWQHPDLWGEPPTAMKDWYDTEIHYQAYCRDREEETRRFIAAVGDWMPGDVGDDLAAMNRALPALWPRVFAPRMAARRHLTLTHGDCYFCQFLTPIPPGDDATYLVDFQSPRADFAAYDLANLIPSFWTPEQRRDNRREERILRRYHDALRRHGVAEYAWDDLMADYRLMVIFFLHIAVWDQTNGSRQSYWWPKLQCLIGAYRDLDCAALLG